MAGNSCARVKLEFRLSTEACSRLFCPLFSRQLRHEQSLSRMNYFRQPYLVYSLICKQTRIRINGIVQENATKKCYSVAQSCHTQLIKAGSISHSFRILFRLRLRLSKLIFLHTNYVPLSPATKTYDYNQINEFTQRQQTAPQKQAHVTSYISWKKTNNTRISKQPTIQWLIERYP